MKTVFLALESYSNISDALRGGFARELAKDYRVVVLTTHYDQTSAAEAGLPIHDRIVYVKIAVAYPRLWQVMRGRWRHALVREYDDWLVTRDWYYHARHARSLRALTALGSLLPKRFPHTEFFTRLEMHIARPSETFMALVNKYTPATVITSTPGYWILDAEMVVFARRLGLPTIAININYDNPYSQAKFLRKTDYLFTWNDAMREHAIAFHHYAPEQVFTTGCLRFDHYTSDVSERRIPSRDSFLRSKNLDPARKTIVIAGPSPIAYPDRLALFRDIILPARDGRIAGNPNVLIRLHPHDRPGEYESLRGQDGVHMESAGAVRAGDRTTKGQKIEMEERDLHNLTATLCYADVVINVVSTTTLEACIFDKPVVSPGYPRYQDVILQYEHHADLVRHCGTKIAKNQEHLAEIVTQFLANPERGAEQRAWARKHLIQFSDGKSYRRAAAKIRELIGD